MLIVKHPLNVELAKARLPKPVPSIVSSPLMLHNEKASLPTFVTLFGIVNGPRRENDHQFECHRHFLM